MTTYTATYSPDDNKCRLYTSTRLDAETYARVKGAGFSWAPKQELFVAPMWTPAREDLMIDLAGEIDDEDTSLVERAEARAERFDDYSERRGADAERAHKAVADICEHIPLGQPILVGHHSEKRALKDAERIDNGMRKAVRLWDTSKYWQIRAAGAISTAKYKELPGVRARRIKGIEADQRKTQRSKAESEKWLKLWTSLNELSDNPEAQLAKARAIANHCRMYVTKPASPTESRWTAYDALQPDEERYKACPAMTAAEVQAIALKSYPRLIAHYDRWLAHYENRLTYERAMLEEQGAISLLDKKPRPAQLPLLNYRSEAGVIATENRYHRGQIDSLPQIDMTASDYAKIHTDYKGTVTVDSNHRVRSAIVKHARVTVFIADSKIHAKPAVLAKALELVEEPNPEPAAPAGPEAELRASWTAQGVPTERQNELIAATVARAQPGAKVEPFTIGESIKAERTTADDIEAMRKAVKSGIKVVVAPQLFPTPANVAVDMVAAAEIGPDHRVLEPSAGTGVLAREIYKQSADLEVVEVNPALAEGLRKEFWRVHAGDFLAFDLGKFDRIVMNPPFANGADIKHIKHAMGFLRPGGRLVAICADGPRQREQLKPLAAEWRELPADTFKDQGTSVRTAMLVIAA